MSRRTQESAQARSWPCRRAARWRADRDGAPAPGPCYDMGTHAVELLSDRPGNALCAARPGAGRGQTMAAWPAHTPRTARAGRKKGRRLPADGAPSVQEVVVAAAVVVTCARPVRRPRPTRGHHGGTERGRSPRRRRRGPPTTRRRWCSSRSSPGPAPARWSRPCRPGSRWPRSPRGCSAVRRRRRVTWYRSDTIIHTWFSSLHAVGGVRPAAMNNRAPQARASLGALHHELQRFAVVSVGRGDRSQVAP